ncbi:ABC transporter ATP-binding protein [Virgibacillus oceani]
MNNLLTVENVSKKYGNVSALDHLSFSIKPGELVSILGPSGCGKSTLLQAIAGLIKPSSGEIFIDQQKVSDSRVVIPPEKRPINMVFQDYALWPHMNVYENIVYGLKRGKGNAKRNKGKVEDILHKLHLDGLKNRMVSHLSGGQQQRVGIARALVTEPSILLMDEPLSNLDIKLRLEMREELSMLLSELNITAVHVTHDPMEAFALADSLLIMRDGQLEQFGPKEEVFRFPKTEWVAQLLGYTNRLQSVNAEMDPQHSQSGTVIWGDQKIKGIVLGNHKGTAGNWKVIIHPEHIQVMDEMKEDQDYNGIKVRVRHAVFQGLSWRVILDVNKGESLSFITDHPLHIGDELTIGFPVQHTFIYKEDLRE